MRTNFLAIAALSLCVFITFSCQNNANKKLPILGRTQIENGDTIFHKIPPFRFLNQDSLIITNESYADNIYIADFFFISCPSICPKVLKQMMRLYDKFEDEAIVKFVSHTIDPKRDDVAALKRFANNLQIDHQKWHFLTGDKDELMDIANDYFVVAFEDPDAPGGFDHSGKIILLDKDGHVRSFCEGTDPDDVTDFMSDVENLLNEYQD
jgi:protein SCO1/2